MRAFDRETDGPLRSRGVSFSTTAKIVERFSRCDRGGSMTDTGPSPVDYIRVQPRFSLHVSPDRLVLLRNIIAIENNKVVVVRGGGKKREKKKKPYESDMIMYR